MKKFNILLSTTIFASAVSLGSAFANGAPADCCDKVADLEARVDRLDAKAVEGTTKKIIIGGWLHRVVQWADNGVESNTAHVSNQVGSSNIEVRGEAKVNNDFKVALQITTEFYPNRSLDNDVQDASDTLEAGSRLNIRKAYVEMNHKKFGILRLGRQESPNKFAQRRTEIVMGSVFQSAPQVFMGGYNFHNSATGRKLFAPVFVLAEEGDGSDKVSYHDGILYESPKLFKMLTLSAWHAYVNSGDLFEVAARMATTFKGVHLQLTGFAGRDDSRGGVPNAANPTGDASLAAFLTAGARTETFGGTFGMILPFSLSGKPLTGPNLTLAGSQKKFKDGSNLNGVLIGNDLAGHRRGNFYKVKVGYRDYFVPWGWTALHVNYARSSNMFPGFVAGSAGVPNQDNALLFNTAIRPLTTTYGVSLNQSIDKAATYLYVAYQKMKLNLRGSGNTYNDIDTVLAGAFVRF